MRGVTIMNATLDEVLTTVDGVLTVLKTVANTPGVNMIPYVAVASSAISAMQVAISVGRNIVPYVNAVKSTFGDGKRVPTEAEVAALDAKIAELEAEVQKPLPPAEEGEPD
jgi:hypothetical protein